MPRPHQTRPRSLDASLSVTRAAEVLGVHPNTVRAWSDAGRLRFYRINPRGDRRFRLGDLDRFLTSALGKSRRNGNGTAKAPSSGTGNGGGRGAGIDSGAVRKPHATRASAIASRSSPDRALSLIATLTEIAAAAVGRSSLEPDAALRSAVAAIRDATGFQSVSAWQLRGNRLTPLAVAGGDGSELTELPDSYGVLGAALEAAPAVVDPDPSGHVRVSAHAAREAACAVPGAKGPWGLLLVLRKDVAPLSDRQLELLAQVAAALRHVIDAAAGAAEVSHRLHRADALRRIAADIASHLDLEELLSRLVDHELVLFGADRAVVYLFEPDGSRRAMASRGLSQAWLDALRPAHPPTLGSAAIAARRPLFAVGYRDDPRTGHLRAAVVQEGFDTGCVAPLLDGDAPALGLLAVYHDRPHPWTDDELETMAALATEASVAIKTARNYAQLATWTAQLQSIQQLGNRLNRMSSVREIGTTIATELRQLIEYHNVRVYRLYGDVLEPVAMQGQVGEYVDETPDQLRATLGSGITGWVAANRVPQLLGDAASDPRGTPIPGTDRLDESMILAPMLYEDTVLGVLVLSKLGLHQFREDDLRLLEIYASFAAQAMANADATERLRQQSAALEQKVRGQRELLRLGESILTTFDVEALLEAVADRLGELVGSDSVVVDLLDARAGLAPRIARGRNASTALQAPIRDPRSLERWVLDHNQPQRLEDRTSDARVNLEGGPEEAGSVLSVPLRGRHGAIGVVTLERCGEARIFSEDEFELVQLFAAQVSVALQNAESHRAVERRAQTDMLTGLLNFGAFADRLASLVAADDPFSLVMLDLDHFKAVNDAHGHQAGDRLLRQVGQAIVGASRDSDAVFRYGGDEFAVLLPGTEALGAVAVAERLRAAVSTVVAEGSLWHGPAAAIDASAGVSSFPTDGRTPAEVLLAADRPLFVAKRDGGARVATAAEGLALAGELTLQSPTPIDPLPSLAS